MRLDFPWADDGRYHEYCPLCHAEQVGRVARAGRAGFRCGVCHRRSDRRIVIDPAVTWWVDDDGEYWHESSGVFVRDGEGRFLLFDRTVFPFALTVPAGHVDAGEDPAVAAERELREETGLRASRLALVATDDVWGDMCRRGSDVHRWHAYVAEVGPGDGPVRITEEEGRDPQWLTPDEILARQVTTPVRYMIERYRPALTAPLGDR